MEPVVGVEVAKGFSVVQAFHKWNEPYGKVVGITHEKDGLEKLGEMLTELQTQTARSPVIVLEATGHYHRGLVAYLEHSGWTYFIVNPLQAKRAKGKDGCRRCLALSRDVLPGRCDSAPDMGG